MVRIPGGSFFMGTQMVDEEMEGINLGLPEPFYTDEHPWHSVRVNGFLLDRTEVTNAAYQQFIDANPQIHAPDDWSRRRHPAGQGNYPVAYVTWHHAQHYCQWRGARLPTEAEWEHAARGPENHIYPWGNSFEAYRANLSTGPYDRGRSRPVGTTPGGTSPYGAVDMSGNVWEWVDADYAPYPGSTEGVTAFSENPPFKVMRGLSFEALGHFHGDTYQKVVAISARSSFRGYDSPNARLRDVGFRCAADLK